MDKLILSIAVAVGVYVALEHPEAIPPILEILKTPPDMEPVLNKKGRLIAWKKKGVKLSDAMQCDEP